MRITSTIIAIAALFGIVPAASAQTFSDTRNGGTTWQPVMTAQPATTGNTSGGQTDWVVTTGGTPINTQTGQYMQNGAVYNPQYTVNYNTSGCQRNLGNALACMAVQGLTQTVVNRSAVREQRDATIAVEEARFRMQGGQTTGATAVVGGACRLTYPNGQVETIQVRSADECRSAIAAAGGVMRQ